MELGILVLPPSPLTYCIDNFRWYLANVSRERGKFVRSTYTRRFKASFSCPKTIRRCCVALARTPRQRVVRPNKMLLSSSEMPDLDPSERLLPQRLVIPTSPGQQLVGLLQDPLAVAGSQVLPEVCVLCHGFRSSKASGTLQSISAALVEAGVSTFCFDFRGNGDSSGTFVFGGYWDEVEDLRSVVTHLRGLGRTVGAILGHSKGGTDVVLYASKYGDVARVVNVSGRCDLKSGVVERVGEEGLREIEETGQFMVRDRAGSYVVTGSSLEDRLATDVSGAATKIPHCCKVLSVHGAVDETVPVEDAYEFHKLIPQHELAILENGDHLFRTCRGELAAKIVPFVKV